ncbi:MAG: DUF3362 domain-containing protein, partial [Paramuribaculum sp.]|nr:DUF3362 domain-containing protein [Paramuribaculum sp.]
PPFFYQAPERTFWFSPSRGRGYWYKRQAVKTKELDFHLEQVQDFTPTPMTVSTEIYYSGVHPYTGKPVSCARTRDEKLAQRRYFFWYDHTYRREIIDSLRRIHRPDLIEQLYPRKK